MITIEIHDEGFQQYLSEVQMQVHNMISTLMEVAKIVELQSRTYVPVDTTRLEQSFKAVPTGEAHKGFIEVEIGYSTLDSPIPPKNYYDYALVTHEGYRVVGGKKIYFHWKKDKARDHYLWWGMYSAEQNGAFELIEGDYLSIWRKGAL